MSPLIHLQVLMPAEACSSSRLPELCACLTVHDALSQQKGGLPGIVRKQLGGPLGIEHGDRSAHILQRGWLSLPTQPLETILS